LEIGNILIYVQNKYSELFNTQVYGSISEAKSRATLRRPKTKRRSQLRIMHYQWNQIKLWTKTEVDIMYLTCPTL